MVDTISDEITNLANTRNAVRTDREILKKSLFDCKREFEKTIKEYSKFLRLKTQQDFEANKSKKRLSRKKREEEGEENVENTEAKNTEPQGEWKRREEEDDGPSPPIVYEAYAAERNAIEELENYLNRLIGKKDGDNNLNANKSEAPKVNVNERNKKAKDEKLKEALPFKKEEDPVFGEGFGSAGKKKKDGKDKTQEKKDEKEEDKQKEKKNPLKSFSIYILHHFNVLGLNPPLDLSQVDGVLRQLANKREFYKHSINPKGTKSNAFISAADNEDKVAATQDTKQNTKEEDKSATDKDDKATKATEDGVDQKDLTKDSSTDDGESNKDKDNDADANNEKDNRKKDKNKKGKRENKKREPG